MKNFRNILMMTLSIISTQLLAQDEIVATWETKESLVEIHKVAERYIGNPIDSLGSRNTEVEVLNLTYENNKWVGKIYSPKRGKQMDVSCHIEDEKLMLEVSTRFITVDLEWQKVSQ